MPPIPNKNLMSVNQGSIIKQEVQKERQILKVQVVDMEMTQENNEKDYSKLYVLPEQI